MGVEAVNQLFTLMQLAGLSPNTYQFFCSLPACSCIGARTDGQQLHATIAAEDDERNFFVQSTIVGM